jgi:hypothetical protein
MTTLLLHAPFLRNQPMTIGRVNVGMHQQGGVGLVFYNIVGLDSHSIKPVVSCLSNGRFEKHQRYRSCMANGDWWIGFRRVVAATG